MHWFLSLLMLFQVSSIDIGPDFSEPSARATRLTSERIQVTLSVRAQPGSSVVAHLIEPGGEQLTVAMADSNDGVYEGTFDTRPIDLVVVFEAIGSGRTSIQSSPVRLTQIGLPPGELAPLQFPEEKSDEGDPLQWVWLALGAGAAALALVALAFLPKRRSGDEESPAGDMSAGDQSGDQSGVDSVTG